MKIKVLQNR